MLQFKDLIEVPECNWKSASAKTRTQMRVMMLIRANRNHLEHLNLLEIFGTIWDHLGPLQTI